MVVPSLFLFRYGVFEVFTARPVLLIIYFVNTPGINLSTVTASFSIREKYILLYEKKSPNNSCSLILCNIGK